MPIVGFGTQNVQEYPLVDYRVTRYFYPCYAKDGNNNSNMNTTNYMIVCNVLNKNDSLKTIWTLLKSWINLSKICATNNIDSLPSLEEQNSHEISTDFFWINRNWRQCGMRKKLVSNIYGIQCRNFMDTF